MYIYICICTHANKCNTHEYNQSIYQSINQWANPNNRHTHGHAHTHARAHTHTHI